MSRANQDVRDKARAANVYLWEVADVLKIQDFNLSRKLRRELPQAEKDKIFAIIEQLHTEREAEQEAG